MALPVLPADGDNPWGAPLRSALTDISNRADQGIATASAARTELTDVHNIVNGNVTTLGSYGTRITAVEQSNATKAADSVVVKLTGDQNISGVKTFSSAPVVPVNAFDVSRVSGLATQLGALAPKASPTFTGTVSGIDKSMVGLGNVDNTTDLLKPVSTATQNILDTKANSADLTNAIQNHNHTGGTNGINIPVSAVTGLQASIDSIVTKEPTIRYATAGSSDLTINSAWFSWQYAYLVRWGRLAYISLVVRLKQATDTGNIANILIASINSSSEFYRVIAGANNATYAGVQFSLSTSGVGILASGVLNGLDGNGQKGGIYLSALAPTGSTLPSGYDISLAGMFILDNATG